MRKLTIVFFLWLTSLSLTAQSMGDSLCVSRCDTLCIPQDSICPILKDSLGNAALEAIPQETISPDSLLSQKVGLSADTLTSPAPNMLGAETVESVKDSLGNVLPVLGIEPTDSTTSNNPSESEIVTSPLFTADSTAQERIPDSTAIAKSTVKPLRSGKDRRRRLRQDGSLKQQDTILKQQDSIQLLKQQVASLQDSLAATASGSPATIQKEQTPSPTFFDFVNKWWLPIVGILLALAAVIGALAFYRQMARRQEEEASTEEEEAVLKAENQKAEALKEAEQSLREKEIALQEKETALQEKAAIEKELEAAQKEKAMAVAQMEAVQSELGTAQKELESAKVQLAQAAAEVAQLKQQLKEKEQQLKEKEEQAQAAAKSASASALGATGRGQQLYEQVKAAEAHIHQWSKSDIMEFENYYKSINTPFMEQLATTYSSLPANHRIYAILVEMGMTDKDIQKLMNISQTTIRSYRHRMRNKEVGGSSNAEPKEA